MPYRLTLVEQPAYLHARVTGTHSAPNILRFLEESYAACREKGQSALLLEMSLSGPSLDPTTIFKIILERSQDASKLRKIAYVDPTPRDPERMKFAETVAKNRGVNVRLFRELEPAKAWMSSD